MLSVEAAEHIALGRPFHIVADKEIEQAVAIVVKPQSRRAESLALAETARVGDVHECAFTGVAEQPVLANAGDENVGEAIIVVVAHSHAHAIEFDIDTRARSHVGESAVPVVVVEAQRGAVLLVAGPVGTVDQQDVLPSVPIVVQKGAAGAERLRQELPAERPTVVLELNPSLGGHVRESKTRRSRRAGLSPGEKRHPRQRCQTCHSP